MNNFFINHKFNSVKEGICNRYDTPPYQEIRSIKDARVAQGKDTYFIKVNDQDKIIKIYIF